MQTGIIAGKYLYDGESLAGTMPVFGGEDGTLIYFYPLNRKETLKMEETLNKLNGISK